MAAPAGATHHIPLTSNPDKVPATMPDGGVSVLDGVLEIVEGGDNWEGGAQSFIDGLAADYSDLQITTEADVPVAFGIRQFNQTPGSRELRAGIGLPSLSSAVGTVYKLWRGYTGGAAENKAGVVPTASGFQGYWPLEEQNSGAATGAAIYEDWTSNGYTGSDYVVNTGKAGKVANGQDFTYSETDHIQLSTIPYIPQYTIQAWSYAGAYQLRDGLLSITDNNGLLFRRDFVTQMWFVWWEAGGAKSLRATMAEGEWELWTATYDGTSLRIYRNSVNVEGRLANAHVAFNRDDDIGIFPGSQWSWNGSIDEAQIHSAARSADWITTYYNMTSNNDTFWTVGAEEAVGGGAYYYDHITKRIRGLI